MWLPRRCSGLPRRRTISSRFRRTCRGLQETSSIACRGGRAKFEQCAKWILCLSGARIAENQDRTCRDGHDRTQPRLQCQGAHWRQSKARRRWRSCKRSTDASSISSSDFLSLMAALLSRTFIRCDRLGLHAMRRPPRWRDRLVRRASLCPKIACPLPDR
jgi:hypothetical protein